MGKANPAWANTADKIIVTAIPVMGDTIGAKEEFPNVIQPRPAREVADLGAKRETLLWHQGIVEIPSVGIKAERLDELVMLESVWVEKRGYHICITTPASYVVQKLYINPERRPERKRAQDVRKVDILLRAMAAVPGQYDMEGKNQPYLPGKLSWFAIVDDGLISQNRSMAHISRALPNQWYVLCYHLERLHIAFLTGRLGATQRSRTIQGRW